MMRYPSSPDRSRSHGGPDALGVPRFDFSTNSNACGPCPSVLAALQTCDASRYPDPAYTQLREQLAAFHCVRAARVLLAGSASEFIFRISAWVAQQGGRTVRVPRYSYGDYAQAAQTWGLAVTRSGPADLQWHADPSSPLGQSHPDEALLAQADLRVLDCAYAPLRLSGASAFSPAQLAQVWQLWTPNKALGLTGVRAAYAIAPLGQEAAVAGLERLCASWPVGVHGVALLQAWVQPEVQAWLADSRRTLQHWKARQIAQLEDRGWTCLPSDTNFFCARPPESNARPPGAGLQDALLPLRATGIKLRDAASFGLAGHVRVGVLSPPAQDALAMAWPSIATSPTIQANWELT